MKKNYHLKCAGRIVSVCVSTFFLSIFLLAQTNVRAQALTGTVTGPGTYADLAVPPAPLARGHPAQPCSGDVQGARDGGAAGGGGSSGR